MPQNLSHDRREAQDAARQAEAAAILRRVRQETDPQTGGHVSGMTKGVLAHFMARDADPADRLEVIGTRIGRIASLVGFAVLAALLVVQVA